MTSVASTGIDFSDIQGIVRFGYSKLTETCFFLLRVREAGAAAAWLGSAPISDAVERESAPDRAMQVAFTVEGLRALAVPEDVIAGFSPEFLGGMAADRNRSRRLGDVGASSPDRWKWGSSNNQAHLVLMLFARQGQLAAMQQSLKSDRNWSQAFDELACLPTSDLHGYEPFGFIDGVSQPAFDWNGVRKPESQEQTRYGNLVAVGEFLLGYPNEYGKYTERPLVARDSGAELLPVALEDASKADIGKNGTYLVFRQLEQDVCGFWRYLNAEAKSDASECTRLAEAMVGRRINGDALLPTRENQIAGIDPDDIRNHFTYEADTGGIKCPFGAHVRRANPRNGDISDEPGLLRRLLRTLGLARGGWRDDIVASTRFHRILRRGREYGPLLSREEAIQGHDDTGEHGLYFICLNANISRQFEFVQNAWIMNAKFDGMSDETDPLLGNREPLVDSRPSNCFSIPRDNGFAERLHSVPQFVTVVGGAYFFLPGIRALRYLANFAR